MQFRQFRTLYQQRTDRVTSAKQKLHLKGMNSQQFYALLDVPSERELPDMLKMLMLTEQMWYMLHRPYFNLWPAIAPALANTTLDIPANLLQPPCGTFAIHPPQDSPYREMLVHHNKPQPGLEETLSIWTYQLSGETIMKTTLPLGPRSCEEFHREGMTQWSQLGITPEEVAQIDPVFEQLLRIVVGVCLLAKDPEMVIPDVLPSDRAAFEATGDAKYVERAARKGVVGWNVGEHLSFEVSPHYRRPHFAIRWCGKGRVDPRLVPVRGSFVKRSKLQEVPTGYLDLEEAHADER